MLLKFKSLISLVTLAISASVHYTILLNSHNSLIALCYNFLPFALTTLLLLDPFSGFFVQEYGIASTRLLHILPFLRSFMNVNRRFKNCIQNQKLILETQKCNILFWCTYVIWCSLSHNIFLKVFFFLWKETHLNSRCFCHTMSSPNGLFSKLLNSLQLRALHSSFCRELSCGFWEMNCFCQQLE